MNSNREKISALKNLLREKHGSGQMVAENQNAPVFETGVKCLDACRIQKGGIHEIVSENHSPGIGWLTEQLIRGQAKNNYAALIDGADSFDPGSLEEWLHRRFLWVRCGEARDAMRAADCLLRDGNLPLVMLDLQLNAPSDLRRIPASSWYRLRTVAEESETTFLVFSAGKLVPCAHSRLMLKNRLSLAALNARREEITIQPVAERAGIESGNNVPMADFLAKAG